MSLCFVLHWFALVSVGMVQQQTQLNAQIESSNGASIIPNTLTAHKSDTNYNILVKTQNDIIGYDLRLRLTDSWGFQPLIPSSLALTLDGHTPFPDKDTDLLLVFAVNNFEYFSFFIHLDISNLKSRIYHSFHDTQTKPVSEWMSNQTIKARWDRISNNGQWRVIDSWNKQALWPLKFEITNDAINDEIIFKFSHNHNTLHSLRYTFANVTFSPHKAVDMYIMGDSNYERFNISSIQITQTYESMSPTVSPTLSPLTFDYLNEYGITIIFGFEYTFTIVELDKITMVLQTFLLEINDGNCKQSVKQSITETANMTIINSTIFLCDKISQNKILTAVEDSDKQLQKDIISDINRELAHSNQSINANKTWILASIIGINETNKTDFIFAQQMSNNIGRNNEMIVIITCLTGLIFIVCVLFVIYFKKREMSRVLSMKLKSVSKAELQSIANQKRELHAKELKNYITNHVKLSLAIPNIVSEESEQSSIDLRDAHSNVIVNSPKLYKTRKYSQNNGVRCVSDCASTVQTVGVQCVSPRMYQTRGVSDDIYEPRTDDSTQLPQTNDDGLYETAMNRGTVKKSNVSIPILPTTNVYKLPKHRITKRQWM